MTKYQIITIVFGALMSFGFGLLAFYIHKAESNRENREKARDRNILYPISCSNASYVFATPIVTELTPGELNTFPRYTHISQDGEVKTYMNLTTKVQD